MHQYSRSTPRSPTNAPSRSTPARSNNERDGYDPRYEDQQDQSSSEDRSSYSSSMQETRKQNDKVIQVSQNLFKRAALIIVSSRINLAPIIDPETDLPRTSQWFQILMHESDELNDKVQDWRQVDVTLERPRPLIVEIYLDIGELARNQTLAVVDDRGRKWDVCEALRDPKNTSASRSKRERDLQVVLERWTITLDDAPPPSTSQANEPMANVYKKASITMHSLLAYANLLPAYKFVRRTMQDPSTLKALRPMFHIVDDRPSKSSKDALSTSLYPSGGSTCENYRFWPLQTPAGQFKMQVTYRRNCNFVVSDYEALVSAHLLGMDDSAEDSSEDDGAKEETAYRPIGMEAGSLPTDRRWMRDACDTGQAYGSLSTFHHAGHGTGTSPISALRAAREANTDSPTGDSLPQKMPPNHRTSQSSKSSLKSNEGPPPNPRRTSVSFKAGSLSSSPAQGGPLAPSPGTSYTRSSDISKGLAQARNIRPPSQNPSEVAVGSPASGSPKAPPITRYSSSFGHRRSRFSSGGSGSKEEDNSSGRGSGNSSKRGSATLNEGDSGGGSGSSGSAQTDDDNIGDFLKMLEQKKDLKSLHHMDDAMKDASTRRTATALSRYRGMRDSNNQLSESISSSMMHRSSGSSSQRLSGVPPTLVGASVSTSSSPGKPISPHTPHTPAIPSRLSSEPIRPERDASRQRPHRDDTSTSPSNDDSSDTTTRNTGSGAIPIPMSPQAIPIVRRSTSAHHRHRASDAEIEPFDPDPRPASLPLNAIPLEDRELGLNDLFDAQQEPEPSQRSNIASSRKARGSNDVQNRDSDQRRTPSSSTNTPPPPLDNTTPSTPARVQPSTTRPTMRRGGSNSTLSSGRGSTTRFSWRNSGTEDEEPLLFTMSELGRQSQERNRERERDGGLSEDQIWSG